MCPAAPITPDRGVCEIALPVEHAGAHPVPRLAGRHRVRWTETNAVPAEAVLLQEAYLEHNVVGPGAMADALHVASAAVLGCRVLVSWNFKHIVHFQKIPLYNAVNKLKGYAEIGIHTPLEMISDEN